MLPEMRAREFSFADPAVRLVEETDITALAHLFELNYGKEYISADVYDGGWVKRCIYGDHIIALVIEHEGVVVANGALLLSLGDHNDRSAELARLVVHPDYAGHGLGGRIVKALIEAAENSLEFVESHARTAHLRTQRLLEKAEFPAIGFLPQYVGQENLALYMKLLADAQTLRSPSLPILIPEVEPLARHVLAANELPVDFATSSGTAPRADASYALGALTPRFMDELIRLAPEGATTKSVFGPLSLTQGIPFMRSRRARYILALDERGVPQGAIGFQADDRTKMVRVVELIESTPAVGAFLSHVLVDLADREHHARTVEVNVSAYSPHHQRLFWNLGFRPAAYVPAMVFQGANRLDIVRMVKLNAAWIPHNPDVTHLTEQSTAVMRIVEQGFTGRAGQ